MWDGLFVLILLCTIMAGASFLSGMLPLYLSLSSRQLRLISALGTGVLVGTALIIIIPEGVETLYSASEGVHTLGVRSLTPARSLLGPSYVFPGSMKHDTWRREAQIGDATAIPGDLGLGTGETIEDVHRLEKATAAQELETFQRQAADDADGTDNDAPPEADDSSPSDGQDGDSDTNTPNPHAYVGISLVAGFLLMYLIDTLPKQFLTRSRRPKRFQVSLNNLSFNNQNHHTTADSSVGSSNGFLEQPPDGPAPSSQPISSASSTTTGLVIHACADGVALGASSTTTSRLTIIIFLALIVHKAPAAFGLTSVLLRQGLSKRTARAHLIVFALAAPLGALLTWFAAHLLGYSSAAMAGSLSTEFLTGVLLLFSGGTFLYVAVHAMQDSGHESHEAGNGAGMNGYSGVPLSDLYEGGGSGAAGMGHSAKPPGAAGGGKLVETVALAGGMLLPLLFNFGHGH